MHHDRPRATAPESVCRRDGPRRGLPPRPANRTAANLASADSSAPRAPATFGTSRGFAWETRRSRPSTPVRRTLPRAEIDALAWRALLRSSAGDRKERDEHDSVGRSGNTSAPTAAAANNGSPTSTTRRRREVVRACRRTSSAVGVGDDTAESLASSRPSSGSVGKSDAAVASSSRACAVRASSRALLR